MGLIKPLGEEGWGLVPLVAREIRKLKEELEERRVPSRKMGSGCLERGFRLGTVEGVPSVRQHQGES